MLGHGKGVRWGIGRIREGQEAVLLLNFLVIAMFDDVKLGGEVAAPSGHGT